MSPDTIQLDECIGLFPAVMHGWISRSFYSTKLGWPMNPFSNFWARPRVSAASIWETLYQSQGIQMSSIQTWNLISWLNHFICRLYSWSQEHSCAVKTEEETITRHKAVKWDILEDQSQISDYIRFLLTPKTKKF